MSPRFVVCTENPAYPASLERYEIYRVLPDREGLVRIIDESGEDYLYPEKYFIAIAFPLDAESVSMDYLDKNSIA